jgi:hypothetical protein
MLDKSYELRLNDRVLETEVRNEFFLGKIGSSSSSH